MISGTEANSRVPFIPWTTASSVPHAAVKALSYQLKLLEHDFNAVGTVDPLCITRLALLDTT
jgi:hypothetical protein